MKPYLDLLRKVKRLGEKKPDRTGVGTISVFGHQMRLDLGKGFPLVTTKKMFFRGVVYEMLWFIKGGTSTRYLNKHGVSIWNAWADDEGNLGPIYGKQWRAWETPSGETIDQLGNVVEQIKSNPSSRRHIVNAWNVADLGAMALPPCHLLFQFYVSGNKLSCQVYIRSNDLFIGAPFNIAEYALLTYMVAQQCGLQVGDLVYTIGDAHIYLNHLEQVSEQLSREPYPLPELMLKREPSSLSDYKFEDIELVGYKHHPPIKAPVAV